MNDPTIEYLVNQKHYRKYMLQKDPEKAQEIFHHHKEKIMDMTNQFLTTLDSPVSIDLQKAFDKYAKLCIDHLEKIQEFQLDSPPSKTIAFPRETLDDFIA